jgi:beta-catenin-like protein 1
MLNEAEANIEQLDSNSLKQLLLSFEKKITKNLKMRMKNSDDPEKFMESELELHAELNELYAVAASPELYPTFVDAGSVTSVLGIHKYCRVSIILIELLTSTLIVLLLLPPNTLLPLDQLAPLISSTPMSCQV